MKKLVDKGKKSKALREVKPVENISKNWQIFLEISPCSRSPPHKLQDRTYEFNRIHSD